METEPSEPEEEPDASGTWGDNLTWALYGTTLYISGEGGMMNEGETDYDFYPWPNYSEVTHLIVDEGVTTIGRYAFSWMNFTDVTLPSTMYEIGDGAFQSCTELKNINLPEGLAKLGEFVFEDCTSLEQIQIPSTLAEISWGAFYGCGLTSIVIPDTVTDIQDYAFIYCSNLKNVTLSDNLITIGSRCFEGCTSLTEIELPDTLAEISWDCFAESGLVHIRIPDSVTQIGARAFKNCKELVSVTLPDNLEYILDNAFYGCSSLNAITLPDTVKEIQYSAFSCSGLVSAVLPGSLTELSDSLFEGCPNLEAVLIPDSVTTIDDTAFADCPNVTIYCYNLSFAHMYAEAYGIPYEILEDEPNTPVYNINVTCGNGGTATITPNPSPANRYVVLEVQPDKSYALSKVRYQCISDPNMELAYEQISDTVIVFFMPASDVEMEIYFTALESPFKDVKETDYFYEPVLWAVSYGITAGVGNERFAPNDPCTRAQVVTFLWRAAGEPEPVSGNNPFKDVKASDYYYKAVLWAVENGITAGTSANKFSPTAPCTRAQVVSFLWRAAGEPDPFHGYNPFTDVKPSDYYSTAVMWAVENRITAGMTNTTFAPGNTCTRGQVVSFLYRFLHG